MINNLWKVFLIEQQSLKFIKMPFKKKIITLVAIFLGVLLLFSIVIIPLLYQAGSLDSATRSTIAQFSLISYIYFITLISFIGCFTYILSSVFLDNNINKYLILPIKKIDYACAKYLSIFINVIIFTYLALIPFLICYIYFGGNNIIDIIT
ncbi:MAG: hypothetical protein ACRCTA_01125, partial [Bacilli bacterium]